MINFLKKRWYFLILILIVLAIFFSQNKKNEKKEEIYKVKKENIKETLTLSGEIDAEEKVVLKFQTSGRLVWVGVKEGDYVKKYQSIASLDSREIKNRLDRYLRTYAIARSNFEQTKDDNWNKQYDLNETTRTKAQRILEQNQYNLDQAVLDVEYQNLLLENSTIWTPIEGIVTHIDVPVSGVNITPANATFEIVNPKTLYFSSTVEQADVVNLKEGLYGIISLDSFVDEKGKGKIKYISFSPKQGETGTVYQLKIEIDDKLKNLPLRLGMSGDIDFVVKEKKNIIAIPVRFLKKDQKGDYVFVKENNRKIKKYIEKKEEIDGKIEIKGLKEGEILINN
ncbi:MAG: efflux RND transporter periplasmic adaptor subunit [Patescibacteria group bacterium]|nr:efflux RND transporter periplasmic adaptor subunit [Patescibacteria group bacterium]